MNKFFSLLFSKYTWTTFEKESRDQKLFKTNRQCGHGRPRTLDFSIELIAKDVLVEELNTAWKCPNTEFFLDQKKAPYLDTFHAVEWKGSQENN